MFHVKHEAWVSDADALGVHPSGAQWDAIERFQSLLLRIAVPRGMIAPGDSGRLWERHIADALRGASEVSRRTRIADVGSGAGIPGVPLAIVTPESEFVLVEPRRGRVAFLEAVVDALELSNVTVVAQKAAAVADRFDVVTARALASPTAGWRLVEPMLDGEGRFVYWAGKGFTGAGLSDIGVSWRLSPHSGLADEGPLVIMARQ
jgi:16S rRNA (guanine527-N7)-methyltransferase